MLWNFYNPHFYHTISIVFFGFWLWKSSRYWYFCSCCGCRQPSTV